MNKIKNSSKTLLENGECQDSNSWCGGKELKAHGKVGKSPKKGSTATRSKDLGNENHAKLHLRIWSEE